MTGRIAGQVESTREGSGRQLCKTQERSSTGVPMNHRAAILTEKILTLSPKQIVEVEDFIESPRPRAGSRIHAYFGANPEDDAYNAL